jgi:hypothetical protein
MRRTQPHLQATRAHNLHTQLSRQRANALWRLQLLLLLLLLLCAREFMRRHARRGQSHRRTSSLVDCWVGRGRCCRLLLRGAAVALPLLLLLAPLRSQPAPNHHQAARCRVWRHGYAARTADG